MNGPTNPVGPVIFCKRLKNHHKAIGKQGPDPRAHSVAAAFEKHQSSFVEVALFLTAVRVAVHLAIAPMLVISASIAAGGDDGMSGSLGIAEVHRIGEVVLRVVALVARLAIKQLHARSSAHSCALKQRNKVTNALMCKRICV